MFDFDRSESIYNQAFKFYKDKIYVGWLWKDRIGKGFKYHWFSPDSKQVASSLNKLPEEFKEYALKLLIKRI